MRDHKGSKGPWRDHKGPWTIRAQGHSIIRAQKGLGPLLDQGGVGFSSHTRILVLKSRLRPAASILQRNDEAVIEILRMDMPPPEPEWRADVDGFIKQPKALKGIKLIIVISGVSGFRFRGRGL